MSSPQQENLPFSLPPLMSGKDFVVTDCNRTAVKRALTHDDWSSPFLIILGESGSGKTHICAIWQELTQATGLNNVHDDDISKTPFIVVDDLKHHLEQNGNAEKLFHAYNDFKTSNGRVLITSTPEKFEQALTLGAVSQDLKSRLEASEKMEILPPDEEALSHVLQKYFREKQISVKPEVIEFTVKRIERSYAAALEMAKRIDDEAMREKRAITIPFIKTLTDL